ncbi:reverse transcriptase domain-containing protein [Tanacetum coccineum]|uniref:Reverse transcriptase domain-containing protein n=1 Tax=Tanacetum coccineum TaxID=301880 RepID=A0ABQ4ZCC2_9ASTR
MPHLGLQNWHQLDTFYNALNLNDKFIDSAAGGNFLAKCLENAKNHREQVHSSSITKQILVSKVSTSSSTPSSFIDVAELKDMVRALNSPIRKNQLPAPAPVKSDRQSCVTAGDPNLPPSPVYEINVPETIKSSCEDPSDLELKDLPSHLEYAFLEGDDKLPIIIAKNLKDKDKTALIKVLNPWVSPVHCVPKKGGITVVKNEENELIPTRLVTGWRVCIDYRKLNDATCKDHFPLPFMDQMLERLAGNEYYCFLDGFSGYFQIPIDPLDQEKTTFTCPYGTFAYRRMPFGLCNAPGTFQRCMVAIFHDMIEKTMEVFMDDFSVFGDSFSSCLSHLDKMLQRCEDTNLVLNWEKCHFMVKEGIVLGHKISKIRIAVRQAKVEDFSKIARPMTHLLEKETPFIFSKECIEAFETLKMKLTQAPILVAPDWDLPFEIMCDASDFA